MKPVSKEVIGYFQMRMLAYSNWEIRERCGFATGERFALQKLTAADEGYLRMIIRDIDEKCSSRKKRKLFADRNETE